MGEDELEVDNTVMVHIRNLRDKIEDDNKAPKYIKTVWGVGINLEIRYIFKSYTLSGLANTIYRYQYS